MQSLKDYAIVTTPKMLASLVAATILAYVWVFSTFVSASEYKKHVQTYHLDRTKDKIDDLDPLIFNLKEDMREDGGDTKERRGQLSKYEKRLGDYQRQQVCLEAGGDYDTCRRDR